MHATTHGLTGYPATKLTTPFHYKREKPRVGRPYNIVGIFKNSLTNPQSCHRISQTFDGWLGNWGSPPPHLGCL